MSALTQGNILDVFVVKDQAESAWATTLRIFDTVSGGLKDGEIGVVGFNASLGKEEIMNATTISSTDGITKYPYIRFVQRLGSELNYGAKIIGKNVTKVTQAAKVDPVEQVWYIGYDGITSTTDLDISAGNEFILTIAYDHDDILWSEQKLRNSYDYYEASPSKKNLAKQMCEMINYKEKLGSINGTGAMVKAELLNNSAATNVTSFGTNLTARVVNGSDVIVVSGAFAAGITVGTMLRLGSDAVTDPVYFVTELNNTANATNTLPARGIRLNMAYQGTSNGTLSVQGTANSNAGGYITTANVGAQWGIKISGLPLTWKKDFFKYNKVKFHFDIKGFGSSTITKDKESNKGKGYYQEVAEWESFAAGNQGALNRTVVPLPTGRTMTDTNGTSVIYNTWLIEQADTQITSPSASIAGAVPMKTQTAIFFVDGGNGDTTQTSLTDSAKYALTNWFASAGHTLAASI